MNRAVAVFFTLNSGIHCQINIVSHQPKHEINNYDVLVRFLQLIYWNACCSKKIYNLVMLFLAFVPGFPASPPTKLASYAG